ncbi:hypothetical protein K2X40_05175 [Candidatus Babeliales bacterium]|nr:hypothetical protein [Candidatus Babeliales bacterium]
MMEFFTHFTNFIGHLAPKQLKKYLLGVLLIVGLLTVSLKYFIYTKSHELVTRIKRLEKLDGKISDMQDKYEMLLGEEERIQGLLNKHKDFNIKSYFETFYKEQHITPEAGWDADARSINEKFDEIALSATFKDQTTEKLVKILEEIEKKEILSVKSLNVKTDKDKKISFDIVIATIKAK